MVMYRITACFSLCLQFLEIGSQLWAAVEYYQTWQLTTWFIILTTVILLPLFLTNFISLCLIFKHMDFEDKCCGRLVCFGFHFVQFGLLWRYFKLLLAYDAADSYEFSVLRMGSYVTGSTIFIVLQCYLMVTLDHWSVVAVMSLVASLISGACTFTLYNTPHSTAPTTKFQHLQGIVHFLWRFFMLLSRFLAIGMFIVALQPWIALVIGSHWTIMFLWSQTQEIFIRKEKDKTCLQRCYDAASCYVMCFDLLKVAKERKWLILCVYYAIIFAENSLMVIIWFTGTNVDYDKWYTVPCIVTVFLSYICGFIFMLINFKCFTNTETPTEALVASDLKDILSNLDYIQEELIWDTFGDISASSYDKSESSPTFRIIPSMAVNRSNTLNPLTLKSSVQNGAVQTESYIVENFHKKTKRQLPIIPQQNLIVCGRSNKYDHMLAEANQIENGSIVTESSTAVKYHKLSNGVERSSSNSRNTNTLDTSLASSVSESPDGKRNALNERSKKVGRKLPNIPNGNYGNNSIFDEAQRYDLESCVTIKTDKSTIHRENSVESLYQSGNSSSSGKSDDFTMTVKSRGFDYHAGQWQIDSDNASAASDSDFAMTWPPSNPKFTIENLTNIPDMTSDPMESVSSWLERINRPIVSENGQECHKECNEIRSSQSAKDENLVSKCNNATQLNEDMVESTQMCNQKSSEELDVNRNSYKIGNVSPVPHKKRRSFQLSSPFLMRIRSLHSDLGGRRTKSKKKKKKFKQLEERMTQRQRPRRVISIESMV